MKMNAEKRDALGQVDWCVQGHALSKITEAKILGDVLNFKRDNWESLPMGRDRIATFCGRLARVARLPGSKENRLEAIGTSAIPVLFGGEFTPLDPKQGNDLRRKVWASARGGTKLPWTTAIEILMMTFSKGHRTDPIQAQAYTSVMSFARLHRLDADTVNDLAFIWQQMRDSGYDAVYGPASGLWKIFASIHWDWTSATAVQMPNLTGYTFPLALDQKPGFWSRAQGCLEESGGCRSCQRQSP